MYFVIWVEVTWAHRDRSKRNIQNEVIVTFNMLKFSVWFLFKEKPTTKSFIESNSLHDKNIQM